MAEVAHAYSTFSLPISTKGIEARELFENLEQHGYQFYNDRTATLVDYGDQLKDNIEQLKQYFMPYIEGQLFSKQHEDGFKRFFKPIATQGQLLDDDQSSPFLITSIEWFICPFQIAFFIIHVKHSEDATFKQTKALMKAIRDFHGDHVFQFDDHSYHSLVSYVNDVLFRHLPAFQIKKTETSFTRSFENFQDRLLLASHFITTNDDVDDRTLFLLNEGEGSFIKNMTMANYISDDYIERYLEAHEFKRYDPYVRYIQNDDIGTMVTTFQHSDQTWQQMKRYFNGPLFYQIFYHYFLKMTLLRFSNDYAHLEWQKDKGYVRELVKNMTIFEAHYYFYETSTQSEEMDISTLLRKSLDLQRVYEEAMSSLNHLFTIQEQIADMQQNDLLFFLTMSTVVSGAFGMNLIIEDWKGGLSLSMFDDYSFLEWFVFVITMLSIVAVVFFTLRQFLIVLRTKQQQRKRRNAIK